MVLIVERKKHNASPLLMSLVVWTHFCISFKGDGLFACYIFLYTKIYLVLMPKSETDADNPFVFATKDGVLRKQNIATFALGLCWLVFR